MATYLTLAQRVKRHRDSLGTLTLSEKFNDLAKSVKFYIHALPAKVDKDFHVIRKDKDWEKVHQDFKRAAIETGVIAPGLRMATRQRRKEGQARLTTPWHAGLSARHLGQEEHLDDASRRPPSQHARSRGGWSLRPDRQRRWRRTSDVQDSNQEEPSSTQPHCGEGSMNKDFYRS
ncbi:unnamed protein product [Sphagnum tenellum]